MNKLSITKLAIRTASKFPNVTRPPGFAEMKDRVGCVDDIKYPSEHPYNSADIFFPKITKEKLPVIIWFHGGAFVSGDKRDISIYATSLASHGYVVIAANYALAPEDQYPAPIIQLGEICNWLTEIDTTYPIDIDRLFFAGDSAGAFLVTQFCLIQTSQQYSTITGISPTIDPERIKGALLYCGPYNADTFKNTTGPPGILIEKIALGFFGTPDWYENYGNEITLAKHISPDFPPVFITDSHMASFQKDGEELAEAFEKNGIDLDTYFISEKDGPAVHEYQFVMNNATGIECFSKTLNFLKKHL